jgi:hypothetical protein
MWDDGCCPRSGSVARMSIDLMFGSTDHPMSSCSLMGCGMDVK